MFSHMNGGEDLTAHVLGGCCVVGLFRQIGNRRKGKRKWHGKIWVMLRAKAKNKERKVRAVERNVCHFTASTWPLVFQILFPAI